jgi:hypothetical protein
MLASNCTTTRRTGRKVVGDVLGDVLVDGLAEPAAFGVRPLHGSEYH